MSDSLAQSKSYKLWIEKTKTIPEPLLQGETRLVVRPIPKERMPIWKKGYKTQYSAQWPAEHFNFAKDRKDWDACSPDKKLVLLRVNTFFAASDSLVNANLLERFTQEVTWLEVLYTWQLQIVQENVHSETYSNISEFLEPDPKKQEEIRNAVSRDPTIAAKANYARKWTKSDAPFALRLLAMAIFEGVFFSGSFCVIYWFKDQGIMKELCASNEAIARDESCHAEFAVLLYNNYVRNRVPEDIVHQLFREAVDIEKRFITESIPTPMIGMSAHKMSQYIEYVADRLLGLLGYRPIWRATNPFRFMQKIGVDAIDNFFDKTATVYSIADVGVSDDECDDPFAETDDF